MIESPVVSVHIPLVLRPLVGGVEEVMVSGDTVGEAFAALEHEYPALVGVLRTADGGAPLAHLQVFLGGQNIMSLDGLTTPIGDAEVLSIVSFAAEAA